MSHQIRVKLAGFLFFFGFVIPSFFRFWTSRLSPSSCVVWPTAIWQGNGDSAGVVSQHAVRHVDTVDILGAYFTGVRSSTCTLKDGYVNILLATGRFEVFPDTFVISPVSRSQSTASSLNERYPVYSPPSWGTAVIKVPFHINVGYLQGWKRWPVWALGLHQGLLLYVLSQCAAKALSSHMTSLCTCISLIWVCILASKLVSVNRRIRSTQVR